MRFPKTDLFLKVLQGAWRSSPPILALSSDQIQTLSPKLVGFGCGGLLGWRLQNSHAKMGAIPREMRTLQRRHALEAVLHETCLMELVPLLRQAGIEPLLVKGWSIAKLYPGKGLRPCGDVDLCVPPGTLSKALEIIDKLPLHNCSIDVHEGVADLEDRTWDEVIAHSRLENINHVPIRQLGWEDQLRHLCLHFIRHGGWRPLWLCDVAVTLESLASDFNWEYCLSGSSWRTAWMLCSLGLARHLLGAKPNSLPAEAIPKVPSWLLASLLSQWENGTPGDSHSRDRKPISSYVGDWRNIFQAMRMRWPNPIEAAFHFGRRPFSAWPRIFDQIRFSLRRGLDLVRGPKKKISQISPNYSVHISRAA